LTDSEETVGELKRTCLFDLHKEAGAKLMGFAGWEVPVQYSNLKDEHLKVREQAGIFDVSHMGEILCKGSAAQSFIQRTCSNDITRISDGQAQYTLLLNEEGGVIDDLIVYQVSEQEFFICANASNVDKDFAWLQSQNSEGVQLENQTAYFAQIALQGPLAEGILLKTFPELKDSSLNAFPFFSFRKMEQSAFGSVLIARTGYTGEDGFEVFLPTNKASNLWKTLSENGAFPIGFGARDTLRLEAALPLHGHELREDLPALTANVSWAVKLAKGDFVGAASLRSIKELGLKQKLTGLEVLGRGLVREDMKLQDLEGNSVGWVTSGTMSPSLNEAIGIAYIKPEFAKIGSEFNVQIRSKLVAAEVVKTPFVTVD
jgi:aminomethyltransferase